MIRWRKLYRSARALLTRATQPIESGRLKVGSDEYKKYKRHQDQANRQLNLLRNDMGGSMELSEFYPYRYLASEGFLLDTTSRVFRFGSSFRAATRREIHLATAFDCSARVRSSERDLSQRSQVPRITARGSGRRNLDH